MDLEQKQRCRDSNTALRKSHDYYDPHNYGFVNYGPFFMDDHMHLCIMAGI